MSEGRARWRQDGYQKFMDLDVIENCPLMYWFRQIMSGDKVEIFATLEPPPGTEFTDTTCAAKRPNHIHTANHTKLGEIPTEPLNWHSGAPRNAVVIYTTAATHQIMETQITIYDFISIVFTTLDRIATTIMFMTGAVTDCST